MESLKITIPDGLDPVQKAEMFEWLSKHAAEMSPERFRVESDAAWQEELARDLRRAHQQIDAGLGLDPEEARRRSQVYLNQIGDSMIDGNRG